MSELFAGDATELLVDESGFVGINMHAKPEDLPSGYGSDAQNCRFDQRSVDPRRGMSVVGFCNQIALPNGWIRPWSAIDGHTVFRDPNGGVWDIIVAEGKVFKSQPNTVVKEMWVSEDITLSGPVEFTQAFNTLIMWRTNGEPAVCVDLGEGWLLASRMNVTPADEQQAPNLRVIPSGLRGIAFQSRIVTFTGDLVHVSDILDYTRYAPTTGAYRINQGESGDLVSIFPYNKTSILCLKEDSVYLLANLIPDYAGNFSMRTLDRINTPYGCIAPKSVVRVGTDVWWLANKRGIVSLGQTVAGEVQALDVPVSLDVDEVIARINWNYASGACAAHYNNRTYFAVPIDAAEVHYSTLLQSSPLTGVQTFGVLPGKTYHWVPGSTDVKLINGSATILAGTVIDDLGGALDVVAETNVMIVQQVDDADLIFQETWDSENAGVSEAGYSGVANWEVVDGAIDLCGLFAGDRPDGALWRRAVGAGMYVGHPSDWRLLTTSSLSLAATTYRVAVRAANNTATDQPLTIGLAEDLDDVAWYNLSDSETYTVPANSGFQIYTLDLTLGAPSALLKIGLIAGGGVYVDAVTMVKTSGLPSGLTGTLTPVFRGVNNCLLVFDHMTRAWTGMDQAYDSEGNRVLMIQDLFTRKFGGRQRLFAVWSDGTIKLLEDGFEDEWIDAAGVLRRGEIQSSFTTRAFKGQGQTHWLDCTVGLQTWDPQWSVTAIRDGVEESKTLATLESVDRTKYFRPAWKPPYEEDNANDDADAPYREDYSIDLAPGEDLNLGDAGVDPQREQYRQHPYRVNLRGKNLRLKLDVTRGRVRLKDLMITGVPQHPTLAKEG